MVGIIHYGMGNITSVANALAYLGIAAKVVSAPADLVGVTHIIIPGVGAFRQAMENFITMGFLGSVQERAAAGLPILGICLGMQILATSGEEGGLTNGLGLIPGQVVRFPFNKPHVPHVGWNDINITRPGHIITADYGLDFYFVHSYYFKVDNPDYASAWCTYGINFPAVVQKDNVSGVQFHPEKSFQAGLQILQRFAAL